MTSAILNKENNFGTYIDISLKSLATHEIQSSVLKLYFLITKESTRFK